jgi:hypothetical protein
VPCTHSLMAVSAPGHDSDLESDPAGAVLEDNDSDEDDDFASVAASVAEHPSSPRDPGLHPMHSISSFTAEQPDTNPRSSSDRRPPSPTRSVSPAPAQSPPPAPSRPSISSVVPGSLARSRSMQSASPSTRSTNVGPVLLSI